MTQASTIDPATGLAFREIRAEDLELFAACFTANASPRTMAHLRWQYLDSPVPKLLGNFAEDSGKVVAAIYAVFPSWMKVGDERVVGTQSLDTLTDRNYRGRGLFVALAEVVYARAAAEGAALVYGFGNQYSAPGLFKKLHWVSYGEAPLLIRPLRSGYVLKRVGLPQRVARLLDFPLPSWGRSRSRRGAIRPIEKLGEDVTAVWRRFSAQVGVAVERDAEYLDWRLRRSGESYATIGFFEDEKLVGFCIYAVSRVGTTTVGKLMDLIFEPSRADVARSLLAEALHRMRVNGAEAVWAWNLPHSPNSRALTSAGFLRVPAALRNQELYFGARGFNDRARRLLQSKSNWYISLLDSDTD